MEEIGHEMNWKYVTQNIKTLNDDNYSRNCIIELQRKAFVERIKKKVARIV